MNYYSFYSLVLLAALCGCSSKKELQVIDFQRFELENRGASMDKVRQVLGDPERENPEDYLVGFSDKPTWNYRVITRNGIFGSKKVEIFTLWFKKNPDTGSYEFDKYTRLDVT